MVEDLTIWLVFDKMFSHRYFEYRVFDKRFPVVLGKFCRCSHQNYLLIFDKTFVKKTLGLMANFLGDFLMR